MSLAFTAAEADEPLLVNQSAREIPVAYSVDVVVVGGSTGAVSAAVAAAAAGAKVFLAAPRPYLGDDMTATLRLWLEPGETPDAPLARELFDDRYAAAEGPDPRRLEFTYQADRPTGGRHPDTNPPSRLADLVWGEAARDSVQFDGDVNIVVDLHQPHDVGKVRVRASHQAGHGGYRIGSITIFTSDDKTAWKQAAVIENKDEHREVSIALSAPLAAHSRYLKLFFQKAPGAARMLLSEIEVLAPPPPGEEDLPEQKPWPRPMYVKQVLDAALLKAKVPFLYSCYACDVLRNGGGNLCGIVMANRAGRQAVIAKTIIDATDRAVVARMAGASFQPYPAGRQTFQRVVIGGAIERGPGVTARTISPPFQGPYPNRAHTQSGRFPIIQYTLQLPIEGDTDAAWAKADQQARTATYHPEQQFTSDALFQIPPDPMLAEQPADGPWQGLSNLPEGAFRPKGVARLLVLGGCAGVSRVQAEKLLRPPMLVELGTRLGTAAAEEARRLPVAQGVTLAGRPSAHPAAPGDIGEPLAGVRPGQQSPAIRQEAASLPVLGRYDVLVIGGGTAGAPAGIAAARLGAKTLIVEQLYGLGGVGTTGAISTYCSGNRVGFTAEVGGGSSWVIEQKIQWWRSTALKAGAEVWFGAIGCGALVDGKQVRGAVVVTPRGRGVVLAKVVVDATGNADVADPAGAQCAYTDESEFAMQGTGLPPRDLGDAYRNTDYTYTDETDLIDVWQLMVTAKEKYKGAFDLGQLVDTRQRRRIVGDYTITILDQLSRRTFPDTIAQAQAGYDTHGYIVAPCLLLRHPQGVITSNVPYRCLLPKGIEGILVTGIALSAHRDAQPVVRMQPDIQNQGYAAGTAAAMAALEGISVRQIDVRGLQRRLVAVGNLAESVLGEQDSYPLSSERVTAAVKSVPEDHRSLAIVLGQPRESLPLLRDAYQAAQGERKLAYAKVLGMLGDAAGMATLLEEVKRAAAWDGTPNWRIDKDDPRARQSGWLTSPLDNTLMALGRTRRPEALDAVLEKLALLQPTDGLSHHRAVYLALEWLGDERAAQPLARLLQQPEMGGHAATSIDDRDTANRSRMVATRELMLARALYRCGDWKGLGEKTLRQYAQDLRGHFARHAQAVLAAGPQYRPAP
jgi:hypothetical protein